MVIIATLDLILLVALLPRHLLKATAELRREEPQGSDPVCDHE